MPRRKVQANTSKISKFIINPEYAKSEERLDEAMSLSFSLDDYYTLVPEACNAKLPEDGAWVFVTRPPQTEWTVPAFSMWYAVEEIRPHKGVAGQARHLAKILTPKGDLWLWPHEYTIVKDIGKYFDFPDDHIHINLLGGEALPPDKLFYLRSRGISKANAIKMLLGEVKSQDVAYVTVHPEYGRIFGMWEPPPERLAFTEEWPGEKTPEPKPQPIGLETEIKPDKRRRPISMKEL